MKKRLIAMLVTFTFLLALMPVPTVFASQGAVQFGDQITFGGIDYMVDDTNQKLYKINENGKYENVFEDCYVLGIYIVDGNLYASVINYAGEPAQFLVVGTAEYNEDAMLMAVSNEQTIFNYLTGTMGLNIAAACGVLANIQAESNFNPNALGDNGTSYGICQWHNTRWDNLKNYCNSRGYDWKTLDGQLRYLQYELENSYKSTNSTLRSAPNTKQGAYDTAYYWCYYFEVPANRAEKSVQRGNTAANTYWARYGNTQVNPSAADNLAAKIQQYRNINYEGRVRTDLKTGNPAVYAAGLGGWQCFGYANEFYAYLWGRNIADRTQSSIVTNANNICIGDYIRYFTGGSSDHSVMVYDIKDGKAYITDCNGNGNNSCIVHWGQKVWTFSYIQELINRKLWGTAGSDTKANSGKGYILHYNGNNVKQIVEQKLSAPSNAYLSPSDCAVGTTVNASWTGVSGADKYAVTLTCTSNGVYSQREKEVGGNSTTYVLNNPGTYIISVKAHNSAGWSDNSTQSGTIIVHANSDVIFKDWDGTILKTQSVPWGGNATAPVAPSRKHYTFQGWDSGYNNITAPLTVNATYKINRYNVKFYGYNDELLSTQSIDALKSAVPPAPKTPEGYVFVDWDSHDYECVEKDLNIKAVYEWGNPDLPNILKITSATRNQARDGYDVVINLTNYPLAATRGRVVVTLKTEAGKMVAVASETYRIDEIVNKSRSVYVPYSGVATTAEASVLGIYDEDKTGVPLANIARAKVDLGLAWSDWSVNQPPKGDFITESRTEYRSRDKQTTTSASSTLSGWTLTGSVQSGWSSWSDWSTSPVSASETRQVETKDVQNGYNMRYYCTQTAASPYYRYYRNYSINGNYSGYSARSSYGEHNQNGWWNLDNINRAGTYAPTTWSSGTYAGKNAGSATGYTIAWDGYIWFTNGETYEKQYRYRDATYTYSFEKWGDWADWTAGSTPAETTSKQVETRTTYRFKSNDIRLTAYNYKRYVYTNLNTGNKVYTYSSAYADSMEFPGEWEYDKSYSEKAIYATEGGIKIYGTGYGEASWYAANVNEFGNVTQYVTYDTLEDTNGEKRNISGVINAPGKAATLLVFRQTNQDPLQSQLEYVDQTILSTSGEYSFNFITKEEPTDKTSDFIIMLAVEGGTTPVYIGKIDAPKPLYTVIFADSDGTELSRQTIKEGDSASVPESPKKEGYNFVGWDNSLTNIRIDLTVAAKYNKQKFNVVFVDWNNEEIQIKEYEYGDILHLDEIPDKEGSSFAGFIDASGQKVETVTQNMVVSVKYALNTYTVKFLDWNGNVVDEQLVEFGGTADFDTAPDVGNPDNVKLFAAWGNMLEAAYVESDVTLYPIARYPQTAAEPVISLASGEYKSTQTVKITCSTPGAKIIFTTDGTTPEYAVMNESTYINGYQYYSSIEISQETQIMAMAYIDGMNESSVALSYYTFAIPKDNSFITELTSVVNGGTANYSVTNNSGNAYTPTVVFAVYDKNGKLVHCENKENDSLSVGKNTGSFTVPALTGNGYTAKLFVWDSLDTMTPLANVAEIAF